jgi:hypothetical protein
MASSRIYKLCLAITILVMAALAGFYLQRKPAPPAPIDIEHGKTIDFSTGQAVVTETEEDQAALKKAELEMEEATAEITFQPKSQP